MGFLITVHTHSYTPYHIVCSFTTIPGLTAPFYYVRIRTCAAHRACHLGLHLHYRAMPAQLLSAAVYHHYRARATTVGRTSAAAVGSFSHYRLPFAVVTRFCAYGFALSCCLHCYHHHTPVVYTGYSYCGSPPTTATCLLLHLPAFCYACACCTATPACRNAFCTFVRTGWFVSFHAAHTCLPVLAAMPAAHLLPFTCILHLPCRRHHYLHPARTTCLMHAFNHADATACRCGFTPAAYLPPFQADWWMENHLFPFLHTTLFYDSGRSSTFCTFSAPRSGTYWFTHAAFFHHRTTCLLLLLHTFCLHHFPSCHHRLPAHTVMLCGFCCVLPYHTLPAHTCGSLAHRCAVHTCLHCVILPFPLIFPSAPFLHTAILQTPPSLDLPVHSHFVLRSSLPLF